MHHFVSTSLVPCVWDLLVSSLELWALRQRISSRSGGTFVALFTWGSRIYFCKLLQQRLISSLALPFLLSSSDLLVVGFCRDSSFCGAHVLRVEHVESKDVKTSMTWVVTVRLRTTSDACEWLVRRLTFHVSLVSLSLRTNFRYYAQIFVSLPLWTFEWNFIERRFQALEIWNFQCGLDSLWAQLWRKTSTPVSTFLHWCKLQGWCTGTLHLPSFAASEFVWNFLALLWFEYSQNVWYAVELHSKQPLLGSTFYPCGLRTSGIHVPNFWIPHNLFGWWRDFVFTLHHFRGACQDTFTLPSWV